MNAPVEGKVWASTVGGGAGATVSTFVIWLLGVLVWGADSTAEAATDAVAAVPFPVIGIVGLAITVGGIFAGGYLAKHSPRPPEKAPAAVTPEQLEDQQADRQAKARAFAARAEQGLAPNTSGPVPSVDDVDGDGRSDSTGRILPGGLKRAD